MIDNIPELVKSHLQTCSRNELNPLTTSYLDITKIFHIEEKSREQEELELCIGLVRATAKLLNTESCVVIWRYMFGDTEFEKDLRENELPDEYDLLSDTSSCVSEDLSDSEIESLAAQVKECVINNSITLQE